MHRLIGGIALAFLIGGTGASARADGSWCVFYGASTYNCGLHSYEQCYATAFGSGGLCRPNFFQGYGQDYGTARRPPPRRTRGSR
jgi:hypothetical protein